MAKRESVSIIEAFGLTDPKAAFNDAAKALFGKGDIPPSQFDLTSVRIFKPAISFPAWLGIKRGDRRVPIYNLFNREQPSADEAFSVKVTFCRDFRGGQFTYDSHLGTDFAVPVGTRITTVAPGRVVKIANALDHGGLKIFIDHGEGMATTYGHLSRALVEEGEAVARGQSIALSGAAGVEILSLFPWIAPHLHLTVLLNGETVDPFAVEGEVSLWLNGNDPVPHTGGFDNRFEPTAWNEALIDNAIEDCTDASQRKHLYSIRDLDKRAMELLSFRMFYNTLFTSFPRIYEKEYARRPHLDLPFRAADFDGAAFPD